jgi:hypothetical protein
MKRFLFAVAVVALSACTGFAEDKPATSAQPATPTTPTVIAATPAIEYAPAQPQRRGLFGRLRNRNNTATYSAPIMAAPVTVPAATPMPKPGTTPEPMPGTKPAGGTTTNGTKPGTTPTPAVVQAGGSLPPGTYTATDGTIIQIGGTQPMAQPMTQPTQSERRGLFSRLRNR